jgi:uncharacterized membrane protein
MVTIISFTIYFVLIFIFILIRLIIDWRWNRADRISGVVAGGGTIPRTLKICVASYFSVFVLHILFDLFLFSHSILTRRCFLIHLRWVVMLQGVECDCKATFWRNDFVLWGRVHFWRCVGILILDEFPWVAYQRFYPFF